VSDFFWGSFLKRWREELTCQQMRNITAITTGLDAVQSKPRSTYKAVRGFEGFSRGGGVRTGFEAVLFKKFNQAMPAFLSFDTDTIDKMIAFEFDDRGIRPLLLSGDDQINGVGDSFNRNLPSFVIA